MTSQKWNYYSHHFITWCQIVEGWQFLQGWCPPGSNALLGPFLEWLESVLKPRGNLTVLKDRLAGYLGTLGPMGTNTKYGKSTSTRERQAQGEGVNSGWGPVLLVEHQWPGRKASPRPCHWCVQGILTPPQLVRRTAQSKHLIGWAHLQFTPNTLLQVHFHLLPLTQT